MIQIEQFDSEVIGTQEDKEEEVKQAQNILNNIKDVGLGPPPMTLNPF